MDSTLPSNTPDQPKDANPPQTTAQVTGSSAAPEEIIDATSVVTPAAPQAGTQPSKKKSWIVIAVIAVLSILVLGVGSAAAYVAYYLPQQPESVLKAALSNVIEAKTGHIDGTADFTEADTNNVFSASFTGNTGEGKLDVTAEVDLTVTKATIALRNVDGKSYYVKLGGLDGLPEVLAADPQTAPYASMLTEVNNQWYEISESLIKQFMGAVPSSAWTPADSQKIQAVYEQHPFLTIKQILAPESVKGDACYHYRIGIDSKKLQSFVSAIKKENLKALKITDDMLKSINGVIGEADLAKQTLDVWITKDSKEFRQVAFSYKDSTGTTDVRFTIVNYNKPFTVEKPKDAKSVLQLLSSFLGTDENGDPALPDTLMQELQGGGNGEGVSL